MNSSSDPAIQDIQSGSAAQLLLETRMDNQGRITYHSTANEPDGAVTEKIYNQAKQLVRIIRRGKQSQLETHVNPESGKRERVLETSGMPDGNFMSSEIVYHDHERSSQVVTILRTNGLLLRMIERERLGSTVVHQGQTDYDAGGNPVTTFSQDIDAGSGLMLHREQIHWLNEGQRAMTEHFYFDPSGRITKHVKILYHAEGGESSQETEEFLSGTLSRHEIVTFDSKGVAMCLDLACYKESGELLERKSTLFNRSGQPAFSRSLGLHGRLGPFLP